MKPKTKTERILTIMHIIAWVGFVGFAIEAGAILTSFTVSFFSPEGSKNLYMGMNLYSLKQESMADYILSVLFMAASLCIQCWMCYLLIKALMTVNLADPFTVKMARRIEKISYALFAVAIIAIMNKEHADWLGQKTVVPEANVNVVAYFFMAGLVFVIAQIFKRGVELQTENDLTV